NLKPFISWCLVRLKKHLINELKVMRMVTMRKINGYLFIPYILWMLLFVVIPVILLIYFSMIDIHCHFNLVIYTQIMITKYFIIVVVFFFCYSCDFAYLFFND